MAPEAEIEVTPLRAQEHQGLTAAPEAGRGTGQILPASPQRSQRSLPAPGLRTRASPECRWWRRSTCKEVLQCGTSTLKAGTVPDKPEALVILSDPRPALPRLRERSPALGEAVTRCLRTTGWAAHSERKSFSQSGAGSPRPGGGRFSVR